MWFPWVPLRGHPERPADSSGTGAPRAAGSRTKRLLPGLLVLLLAQAIPTRGQVLYDADLGTLPSAQGWSYAALPGTAQQTLLEGAVRLDTALSQREQAGYARQASAPLDRTTGFALSFTVRILSEAHSSPHRAGFSVILLAHDRRGIELGFWIDRVFAQADAPLFTHGEEAALEARDAAVDCVVGVRGDRYRLFANGTPLLEGSVRDYTPFVGLLDPYETPDFIFLGDDTTSAGASVEIGRVTLVTAPSLELSGPGALAWSGVPGTTYRVEVSRNLEDWELAGVATSGSTRFTFTGEASSTEPARFWRVVYP